MSAIPSNEHRPVDNFTTTDTIKKHIFCNKTAKNYVSGARAWEDYYTWMDYETISEGTKQYELRSGRALALVSYTSGVGVEHWINWHLMHSEGIN